MNNYLPAVAVIFAAFCAGPAWAADSRKVSGVIKGFECGDNCYLTLKAEDGKEIVGLCVAPECAPWNEATEIPKALLGRRVSVTISIGNQLDGNGDVAGQFQSFPSVRILEK